MTRLSGDDPHALFFDRLVKVNRKLRAVYDARAKEQGLTLSRARLLNVLADEDGLTQTRIASELEMEQPSVVSLLDGLEKKGFVTRRAAEGDRRSKQVFLTPMARQRIGTLRDFGDGLRLAALQGVAPADLEVASRVLAQALGNLTGGERGAARSGLAEEDRP